MDITRGSLDGITRSGRSRQRQRPDSRVSLHSGSGSPLQRPESYTTRGSFEVLPPEPRVDFQEGDLTVEEYLTSGEEEDGRVTEGEIHSDAIEQLERLILSRNEPTPEHLNGGQLSGRSSSASPSQEPAQTDEKDGVDPEEEMLKGIEDPKLRKAIKKMRKLDKILSEKIDREKEVKRQRATLHKQYEEELERIRLSLDRSEAKEESDNTMKFLALVPPLSHSEGITSDDGYAASPLFHTQPPDGEGINRGRRNSDRSSPMSETSGTSQQTRDTDGSSGKDTSRSSRPGHRRGRRTKAAEQPKDEDDFIQRNIQLASDAGNIVAMTDDEKKRLGDLLKDVELLGDETDPSEEVSGFELQMLPGVGFQPNKTETEALKDLDNRLKALMPPECFQDICSTPSMLGNSFGSGRTRYTQEAYDLGEKILQGSREERDHQERLRQIEEELVHLQAQVEHEISSPSLSRDELDDLFKQCDDVDSRTQSALSSPRTPRPVSSLGSRGDQAQTSPGPLDSSRSEKLSRDTLERLLDEAKQGLGYEDSEDYEDSEGGDGVVTQNGEGESRDIDSRASQMSGIFRVPLVSHDIIQQLLRNPRATMEEAEAPPMPNSEDVGQEEQGPFD